MGTFTRTITHTHRHNIENLPLKPSTKLSIFAKMTVKNVLFNILAFSLSFIKLIPAQEENNDFSDDEEYTEPSGDGSDEDPSNVNPLSNDFDMTNWLIIGGSVVAVVIGIIAIVMIKKNKNKGEPGRQV